MTFWHAAGCTRRANFQIINNLWGKKNPRPKGRGGECQALVGHRHEQFRVLGHDLGLLQLLWIMHEAIDLLGDAFGDFAGVLEAIRFYAVRNVFSRSVEQVVQVAIRILLPAILGVKLLLVPNLSNARAKRRRQPKVGDNRNPLLLGQSNVHHLGEHVALFGESRERIHRLFKRLVNEAQGELACVLWNRLKV